MTEILHFCGVWCKLWRNKTFPFLLFLVSFVIFISQMVESDRLGDKMYTKGLHIDTHLVQ